MGISIQTSNLQSPTRPHELARRGEDDSATLLLIPSYAVWRDSSRRFTASRTDPSADVDHAHSQFFVKVWPRSPSLGNKSCSGTTSKSISGQLNVKYSPFKRARSCTLLASGRRTWSYTERTREIVCFLARRWPRRTARIYASYSHKPNKRSDSQSRCSRRTNLNRLPGS
jgi:hypothetical protein